MSLILRLALLAILAPPLHAAAQQALEIIPLRHRTVEQVLPVLRPLLEPGAVLTGQRGQLVVRTSPDNLAELRRALSAIDQPARRLVLSVRFDDAGSAERGEITASGRIGNRASSVDIRGRQDQSRFAERVDQRIQVLEGGRALISTGQSVPLAGGVWHTGTGFEAIPRLSGDRVLVDIAPQKESFEQQQRMVTTVSARLGEWFEVGRSASSAADGASRTSETRSVWLKVEALP